MKRKLLTLLTMLALAYGGYSPVKAEGKNYSDYVNPLMGTLSEHQLSTGNTYPSHRIGLLLQEGATCQPQGLDPGAVPFIPRSGSRTVW